MRSVIVRIVTSSLALAFLCGPVDVGAQADALGLQECIAMARTSNLRHLSEYQSLLSSHAQLQRARSPYRPQASASFKLPTYSEFRDVEDNVALSTRIVENRTNLIYQGQVRVTQRLPHLGAVAITSSGQRQEFTSDQRSDYLDVVGDVRASYTQELLHSAQEAIALKQSKLNYTSAGLSYDYQQLALESEVTDAFYNLVQAIRQLEIEEQRLEQSRANLDLAQRKFQIGLIAEVEALKLRVTMLRSEANFAQAETQIERRRDALRQILGMEMNAPLAVVTEVESQQYEVDPDRAMELGLARRTDMLQAEITEKVRQLSVKDTKRRNGINATLNANISLLGRGDELADIRRNLDRNYWDVGIQLNVPLLDSGDRRGQLRQAEIALKQSSMSKDIIRQDVIRQVRDAVRNLNEAERQIALRQASLEVSERTYAVEKSRFELGLAQSQELLDAQAELTQNRIDALDAVISYQRQLKNLRLATMASLEDLAAGTAE
jgi:outer membrane protein TolC